MRLLKKIMAVTLTLTLAAGLGACAKTEDKKSEGKKKVGYVINNLNDTFQTYVMEAAKKKAAENNLDIEVVNSMEDVVKQQDLVRSLIQKGVDALVVVPVDTSAMDSITSAAQEAKIPLAYVNRNPFAGKEDKIPDNVYYVGSDEKSGGVMQTEYIASQIGEKGGIAVLMGILGNEGAVQRTAGVKDTVKAKYPNVDVLAAETGNWQRDEGLKLAENFITTYGDKLTAIIANNDEMALGAIEALKQQNLIGKIKVAGLDAIPDALEALKAGDLTCTVFQDAEGQGGTAVQIVSDVLNGKAPEKKIAYIPFQLVTKENVDKFTK